MDNGWVKAGMAIAKNPTVSIRCPVDSDHGYLKVKDVYVAGRTSFERVMECPSCHVRNALRMTYSPKN